MTPDLVSAIIPVYNRPILLVESVHSVLAQTYRPIEIIIVDDGSTDETGAVADRLEAEHPDIISVLHLANEGPGVAREAGRKVARGEFIQYLDSDDLLLPRKFELQVAALRGHPECGVSYGITAYENTVSGKVVFPWRRTGVAIPGMFPAFAADRWWGTSTPLYRRIVTDEAGPWLNLINCEDWEYDCRIAVTNVRLAWVAEKVSRQRCHDESRLSADCTTDPVKLKSRSIAHKHMAGHIEAAGLDDHYAEVQQFGNLTFLLARQCGAAGLAAESKAMVKLVKRLCPRTVAASAKFMLYRMAAEILGWGRVARWSAYRDRLLLKLGKGKT